MNLELPQRSRQILEAIVEDYIATAEPVGSSAVARRHAMTLSPATVRNVMARLEEQGLLISPHTSAGRVPTEKAYRLYVDSMVALRQVSRDEKRQIIRRCRQAGAGLPEILKETSRTLSSLSNYMAFVVAPSFTSDEFRHIEFLALGPRKVLAILVSRNGIVQNRLVETERDFSPDELIRMGNYLKELMEGLSISQSRERILAEMKKEKVQFDTFLSQALHLSEKAVTLEGGDIFVEGQARILDHPEFSDVRRMQDIFRAFEQKAELLQLLECCMSAEGVQIYIGSESPMSRTTGVSLITSRFVTGSNTIGMLGVIGPTRMGYSSVIPIVDYTARLVSRLLNSM
ncbi:heat-inducible transcriptional repressor HrcA [Geobacter sp. SVR]|uniref:heat-inducible transcriptional repressor HrcA n=1 Tax=Geobacter sp. SVR TaxID=2495594 RepID=UPI00143F049E|nr:heat-inducible transcriptional repressor HrcA [Geobacter sp. SVR]BCS54890.1 heat-inducible transcription repressor HrcA [Geobacter sp. SVR]GCF87408.1 heat-inducible transcription repressor HrcA [Geobacter sp. SVR]